jgi:ABC-2 type transport system permease protein
VIGDVRATMIVARRELIERVRTKWFAVMTLLGPLFMIAIIVVPAVIALRNDKGAKVDIVDRSTGRAAGKLAAPIGAELEKAGWKVRVMPATTTDDEELARIGTDEINGFVTVDRDAFDGGPIAYQGDNASSQVVDRTIKIAVATAFHAVNAELAELTPAQRTQLAKKPNLLPSKLSTGEAGTSGTGAFLVAYFLAVILYTVITLYGVAVMRSVVTEKTSRVMELMVATVKPRSLMAGKILGVGGAGLIQVGIWLLMGAAMLAYRDTILGWFGLPNTGSALPAFAVSEIVVSLAFFVFGFFFYAAMYAAAGAMVSSEQETQQVQMPVTMLLVIGVLCLQVVSNAPRGSATVVMSNVPLWSPLLMPMRYLLGGASLGEVAISMAFLVASMLLVVRVSAKIYRVGVLMYGKRPGLRELLRWLRY